MRNTIFTFLLTLFMFGCQNAANEGDHQRDSGNSLFELSFRDYKEIELFRNFEKVSDTSIDLGTWQNQYRLLELRNNSDNIVMFYKKAEQDSLLIHDFVHKVLDTLHIRDLEGNEKITIGYCYKEGINDGEIIAIVKDSDSRYVKTIKSAWRANPQSGKIEALHDFSGINCLNEGFKSESAKNLSREIMEIKL